MPKYEFTTIPSPEFNGLIERLDELGQVGWTVVDHDWGHLVLAREVPGDGTQEWIYRCTDRGHEHEEFVFAVPLGYRAPMSLTLPLDSSIGSGEAIFKLVGIKS